MLILSLILDRQAKAVQFSSVGCRANSYVAEYNKIYNPWLLCMCIWVCAYLYIHNMACRWQIWGVVFYNTSRAPYIRLCYWCDYFSFRLCLSEWQLLIWVDASEMPMTMDAQYKWCASFGGVFLKGCRWNFNCRSSFFYCFHTVGKNTALPTTRFRPYFFSILFTSTRPSDMILLLWTNNFSLKYSTVDAIKYLLTLNLFFLFYFYAHLAPMSWLCFISRWHHEM